MKFFDASERKKVYINNNNINIVNLYMNSSDYLSIPISDRLHFFKELTKDKELTKGYANSIVLNISENEDTIIDYDEIASIYSNLALIYAEMFPESDRRILQPKERLVEKLTISPIVAIMLMSKRIVNKPFQITIKRTCYNYNGEVIGKEEMEMIG